MLADPHTLSLLQSRTTHIRNICILAHVDHGKTTLSDYLLSSNGIISSKIAGKVRFLDSRPDEQDRGITMKSSSIALLFQDKRKQQDAALTAALTASNTASESATAASTSSSTSNASSPSASDLYLINLIDSPGHVDFSSEVSTAVRVSDGCLVLVDALEGICVQTHAVLKQAWNEGVKPILVLNKIDRLISELHMEAQEAYLHIVKIIEQINVITSTFITSEAMEKASTSSSSASSAAPDASSYEVDIDDSKQWSFAPETGNVIFASAFDCWAFTIPQFTSMLCAKLGFPENKKQVLQKCLWGEYYYDAKNKKVMTKPSSKNPQPPMFVQMIFENLFQFYQTVLIDQDQERTEKIISTLGLKFAPRELTQNKEPRTKLQLILSKWLPIPAAILGAVVDHLPNPIQAQSVRMEKFWPGIHANDEIARAVKACNTEYQDVLIYVSKMVDMGDMIQKLKESQTAAANTRAIAAAAAANGAPVVGVRAAYQKGRFTAASNESSNAPTPSASPPPTGTSTEPTLTSDPSSTTSTAHTAEVLATTPSDDTDSSRFVAFARIWCGTLRIGPGCAPLKLHFFGPKYDPHNADTHAAHATTLTVNDPSQPGNNAIALYLLMGSDIQQITSVPAGNVFAIGGLGNTIINTATVSSSATVTPFRNMQYQSSPIVRVAIETEKVSDMAALIRGLRLLNQADGNVAVALLDSGEHVINASGELHLERCIRDLKDRFCPGIKLIVSPPLISFRETCLEDRTIEAVKIVKKAKQSKKESKAEAVEEEVGLEQDRKEKEKRKQKEMNVIREVGSKSGGNDDSSSSAATAVDVRQPDSSVRTGSDAGGDALAQPATAAAASSSTVKSMRLKHIITDSSANKCVTITVQAIPLPKEVTRMLEERVAVVKGLVLKQADEKKRGKAAAGKTDADASSLSSPSSSSAATVLSSDDDTKALTSSRDINEFVSFLRSSFAAAPKHLFTAEDVDKIWSFGPRSIGANILLNRVEDLNHLTALIPKVNGGSDIVPSSSPGTSQHGGSVHDGIASSSNEDRESIFLSLSNALLTGFQLACAAGPLCEEPLMGVAFSLEAIELTPYDVATRGQDPFGPMSGQTMSLMQRVCRAAFDARARRLMEAIFRVELQCEQEALGGLHGVLAKRRGTIFSDELREGTTTYHIQAYLPVAESFGFAGDLRKKTGGEASPQLIFSHWEVLQQDPFFVPRSEDELEFHGAADSTPNLARDLIDHVRRRKGLAVQQKTVEHAEKQRTIKR